MNNIDHDKETINEHIRNGLSPINMLIQLIENKESILLNIDEKKYEDLLKDTIKNSKLSINKLCKLGYNKYENSDFIW